MNTAKRLTLIWGPYFLGYMVGIATQQCSGWVVLALSLVAGSLLSILDQWRAKDA